MLVALPRAAGSSHYKMCAGLNGFDPRTTFVFGGVRIGIGCIGCMSLVAVISRYTRVPVKLDIRNLRHTLIVGNLSDLVVSLYVEALRKMERYVYRICKGL